MEQQVQDTSKSHQLQAASLDQLNAAKIALVDQLNQIYRQFTANLHALPVSLDQRAQGIKGVALKEFDGAYLWFKELILSFDPPLRVPGAAVAPTPVAPVPV